jgi:hypothetical protein
MFDHLFATLPAPLQAQRDALVALSAREVLGATSGASNA